MIGWIISEWHGLPGLRRPPILSPFARAAADLIGTGTTQPMRQLRRKGEGEIVNFDDRELSGQAHLGRSYATLECKQER